ncbi:hypothetical protein CPC08DRAFT_814111 [Agrocybe pediades]|nr:hypothetical protein CPC08DRAFT_814111 [Agrocybe pediades]
MDSLHPYAGTSSTRTRKDKRHRNSPWVRRQKQFCIGKVCFPPKSPPSTKRVNTSTKRPQNTPTFSTVKATPTTNVPVNKLPSSTSVSPPITTQNNIPPTTVQPQQSPQSSTSPTHSSYFSPDTTADQGQTTNTQDADPLASFSNIPNSPQTSAGGHISQGHIDNSAQVSTETNAFGADAVATGSGNPGIRAPSNTAISSSQDGNNSASPSSSSSSSANIGGIVGGIVGAICLILLLLIGIWFYRRRRRRNRTPPSAEFLNNTRSVPFRVGGHSNSLQFQFRQLDDTNYDIQSIHTTHSNFVPSSPPPMPTSFLHMQEKSPFN